MKEIKIQPETIKQKEYVSKVVCDFCSNDIEDCQGSWDSDVIKIEANIGAVYPESDCRTLYIIDVCSKCFMHKIKPTLEEKYKVSFREISSDERYEKHE